MLDEYYEALARLKVRRPLRVPKGTRITNDAVALEAGRGRGSIKKSRAVYRDLIADIKLAGKEQEEPTLAAKNTLEKAKRTATDYKKALDAALEREISLLRELYLVKQQLATLTGAKVIPIRGPAVPNTTNVIRPG